MSLQILDIVLYGPPDEPRIVTLRPGALNIITGASKRGKSALIAIIDYCLGSSECDVAFGPIRSTVEWYALRVQAPGQQAFIARQAPAEGGQSNSAVYLEMAGEVGIPLKTALSATTNIDAATELLSRMTGIVDNIHQPPAGQTRPPATATIKHALFFCFQPQYEIVNPHSLFYRQTKPYHPQLIQDVLPYFLGAVSDDHLLKMGRLRTLRQDRRRVEQALAEAKAIAGTGASRAMGLLSEARDIGLISLPPEKLSDGEARDMLRAVMGSELAQVPTEPGADEYARLLESRDQLTTQLRRLDADRQGVTALINDRRGFTSEGREHVARLQTLNIYQTTDAHTCPLCAAEITTMPSDSELVATLADLETKLANVNLDNPHLEQLAARLEEQGADVRRSLTEVRESMVGIERSRQQLTAYREFVGRAAHVRGRISIYLEAVPAQVGKLDELTLRASDLDRDIEALEKELSKEAVQERLDSIVSVVSEHITKAGRELDLEHAENPLRLDVKRLTVTAQTTKGAVPMDKMGSGANWVGYHIAVHLALHRIFVQENRPVPRFLILDQPSQVYFPADRDIDGRLEVGKEGRVVDEDRVAVLRMFTLIKDTVESLAGEFQVLVTEHADPAEQWFQEAVVEKWRDGKALIPAEWIATVEQRERAAGTRETEGTAE